MFHIAVTLVAALSVNSAGGLAAGQAVEPLPSIEITAPDDVASVRALSDTLDALSEKVTACVKAGRKSETCQCSYPQNLTSLRKGYASLIKQHPEWKDQLLSYRYKDKEQHDVSGIFALQNLRRQLETLKCEP